MRGDTESQLWLSVEEGEEVLTVRVRTLYCTVLYSGWPVILLSKKATSLGLFQYFLILLSFFGLKFVLNILLLLKNYEN